jgi:hypothetical protein
LCGGDFNAHNDAMRIAKRCEIQENFKGTKNEKLSVHSFEVLSFKGLGEIFYVIFKQIN